MLNFQHQRSANAPNNISTLGQRYHVIWDDDRYLIDNIKCKYKNWNHYFEVSLSDEPQ